MIQRPLLSVFASSPTRTRSCMIPRPLTTKTRRSVSFAPEPVKAVHTIERVIEKNAVWFSAADIHKIKQRNLLVVRLSEDGNLVESDEVSMLGLEPYTRTRKIRFLKDAMYDAVLDEQDRQQQKSSLRRSKYNSEKIAKAYRQAIEHAEREAANGCLD